MELIKTGEKDDMMVLSDLSGNSGLFRFLDMARYNGREYAAIADEEDEVYIMEFIDGKNERFIEIEDDETFGRLTEIFEDIE